MENIYEINKKLLGSILPYGDSNIDEERTENLENTINLIKELIEDIIITAKYKDRQERSIRDMGVKANNALLEIIEMCK